jgi:hypothetical protein
LLEEADDNGSFTADKTFTFSRGWAKATETARAIYVLGPLQLKANLRRFVPYQLTLSCSSPKTRSYAILGHLSPAILFIFSGV